jgi:hypothetical protein
MVIRIQIAASSAGAAYSYSHSRSGTVVRYIQISWASLAQELRLHNQSWLFQAVDPDQMALLRS